MSDGYAIVEFLDYSDFSGKIFKHKYIILINIINRFQILSFIDNCFLIDFKI